MTTIDLTADTVEITAVGDLDLHDLRDRLAGRGTA